VIDLSVVVHSPHLSKAVTIERMTGGYYNKSVYVRPTTARFTVTGVFVPGSLKSILQSELGSQASGDVTLLVDESVEIYTTRDDLSGNNISDKIITNPGTMNEVAYRIISENAAFGVRVVSGQREGAS
jgi:hypothetical protein